MARFVAWLRATSLDEWVIGLLAVAATFAWLWFARQGEGVTIR